MDRIDNAPGFDSERGNKMKTRMHEILGVEPGERFGINGYASRMFWLDEDGWMFWGDMDGEGTADDIYRAITYGIIRKPRLTAEQIEILKALKALGCNWITKDDDGRFEGWEDKPYTTAGVWCERDESNLESCFVNLAGKKAMTIDGLISYAEPLDIAKTLRDNGIEVEG